MRSWTAALAAVVLFVSAPAQAQDAYPSRPVRIVVPAAPGGSFDALARIVAQSLSERWPQRVIVDNRPGGGGNIGAGAVAKADPDGTTILVWNDTLLINPYLYKEIPYDPKKDFEPIVHFGYLASSLSVHPGLPVKTFAELLDYAKAHDISVSSALSKAEVLAAIEAAQGGDES